MPRVPEWQVPPLVTALAAAIQGEFPGVVPVGYEIERAHAACRPRRLKHARHSTTRGLSCPLALRRPMWILVGGSMGDARPLSDLVVDYAADVEGLHMVERLLVRVGRDPVAHGDAELE